METTDLAASILALKPKVLKSAVKIKVTCGDVVRDRFMYSRLGRMLFCNKYTMLSFIKNLYLPK